MDSKKPNIVFIVMDALRPKNLSCFGYRRNTSPNIDSLAKKGVLFEKAFSSCNGTNNSFLSILGGRHVLGQSFKSYLSKEEMKSFFDSGGILLQEILKNNGYKTYCLKKLYGWQRNGFDYYFKQRAQEKSKKWKLSLATKKIPFLYKTLEYLFWCFAPKKIARIWRAMPDGKRITNEAIRIIKGMSKEDNFFMWIDYSDTHSPYNSPGKFTKKFVAEKKSENLLKIVSNQGLDEIQINSFRNFFSPNDTLEDVIARYDSAIAYDDYLIKKVINAFKEKGVLENLIIFFLSDHGESLTEHEIYFTHHGLYDVCFHVPLIISGKNIPKDKKIKALTQLEDIPPTVLSLLKINYDPFLFDGKSLLPLISGKNKKIRDQIFIEEHRCGLKRRAIRTKKYKYVESPEKKYSVCTCCNTTHGDIIALYDLEKDPDENVNIAKKNKKLLIEMKLKLNKTIKDLKTVNEKRKIQKTLSKI